MPEPIATIALVPREVFSTTERTIETLYERTEEPFDLVCVDGASPPAVRDYLDKAAAEKGFTLLRSDRYLTPNQARNLAADWAMKNLPSPNVVFVDNDVLVAPGWLGALTRAAEETGAGVVGPAYYEHLPELSRLHMLGGECRIATNADGQRVYHERHRCQHQASADADHPLERHETELIEFHAVLVRREVFERIGLLDEQLLAHSEHGDLCLTAREAGFAIWIEPASRITYAPPRRLNPADREFFFLRWSDARTLANQQRMKQKWRLDHVANTRGRGLAWVRGHRRLGLSTPRWLRRVFGRKLGRSLEKRLVAPLEWRLNRRRYPLTEHNRPPEPVVTLVHTPTATRASAA